MPVDALEQMAPEGGETCARVQPARDELRSETHKRLGRKTGISFLQNDLLVFEVFNIFPGKAEEVDEDFFGMLPQLGCRGPDGTGGFA